MTARSLTRAVVAAAALLTAVEARAQVWVGSDAPRRGSIELSAAGIWIAGQDFGERDAELTPNPGTGASSFVLFESDVSIDATVGAQASLGVYLSRRVSIEGGIRYARPQLHATLTSDFEDAPEVTATTTVTQYLFSGSLLYHFGEGRRALPFIAVGGGHLRDVHTNNELVETGTEYHGKVGVKMWFGSGRRRVGLRAEGGISVIDGGFSFADGRRTAPTAAAGLSYLF